MNSSDVGGGKSPQSADTGNAQDERNALLAYEVQRSITRSLPLEDRGDEALAVRGVAGGADAGDFD